MMTKAKLFLLFISLGLLGASCTPTDVTPGSPITVTISPSTTTAAPGDSVTFAVNITDNNTLKDVVVEQSIGGGTSSQIASLQLSGKSWSFNQGYRVPLNVTSGNIVLTFTVDDASNTQKATATITIKAASTGVNTYTAKLLGSYNETVGSFFSTSTGTVYTKTAAMQNQTNVDMAFFVGSSNGATLAAPSDASFGTGAGQISSLGIQDWSTKNNTNFRSTSLNDISTDDAAVRAGWDNGTDFSPNTRASNLATGKVVAFKTVTGKYGLLKVSDITGADAAAGKGIITINVAVTK